MSFDWNWFFSSFCQSAAALLGIIAAFIISRLLGLSEKINLSISALEGLVIEYTRITRSFTNRYFDWYIEHTMKSDDDFIKALKNQEYATLKQSEILSKIYEQRISPYKADHIVLATYLEMSEKYTKPKDILQLEHLDLHRASIAQDLGEEREKINALEVEAKTLIALFTQNEKDLKAFAATIQPLKIIIIALMISFPLTVIYPLHFMPVVLNENPAVIFDIVIILKSMASLKFLLLTIFFFSIEGIFYYFLMQTNTIKKTLNAAIDRNSADYKNIKSYSKYL